MEALKTKPAHGYHKHKRMVVMTSLLLSIILGPLLMIVDEHSSMNFLLTSFLWIGSGILVGTWCYLDSLERHQRLPKLFRIWIVLFGVMALFYYLIKSRGIKKGGIAILKEMRLLIGAFLLLALSGGLFVAIFNIPIPE